MISFSEFLAEQEQQTLYVSRPLDPQSATKLREWAISQGFDKTLDPSDMHVTVAFSKKPVDWGNWTKELGPITIRPGQRSVTPLGDKGAVVLKVQSPELTKRWQQFIDGGASWDYPEYQPHISITYNGDGVDLSAIQPYDQPIDLSGEKWAKVVLDWDKKIKEN